MPNMVWGDGTIWGPGVANVIFIGRIGPELEAAQTAKVRQTGLRVQVRDERLNLWDHVAGVHAYTPEGGMDEGQGLGWSFYRGSASNIQYDLDYDYYRGGSAMCVLGNGNIIRVRWGDPSNISDRQLWIQTVTDPNTAAQWTSWSVLYSGNHYGASVVSDGTASGYIVYHSKSDGIYRNNTKQWEPSAAQGKALNWVPVWGRPDAGWVVVIKSSIVNSNRVVDNFWTDDLVSDTPVFDPGNFAWFRGSLGAIEKDGQIVRVASNPIHFNSRDGYHGHALYHQVMDPVTLEMTPPFVIRGVGGGGGVNYISGSHIRLFSDGYYYLAAYEIHQGDELEGSTSLGFGLPVWIRSKNLKHWSEPVVGPATSFSWGAAGFVESNGYIYWADTEVVYRRPIGAVNYDLSNFVPTVEFDLPRDNQVGKGKLILANPEGIHDAVLNLSDREITVEPGLRVEDGSYEFKHFDRFFIKQCNRELQGRVNRLHVEFGNLWDRLDTDMRDITNHIGQIDWSDWASGKRNEAFNYYFLTDTAPVATADARLQTRGICLYTGWKGHNPDITVSFSGLVGEPRVILRYKDSSNYEFLEFTRSTGALALKVNKAGTVTTIDTWSTVADSTPKLRIQRRWNYYRVWVNNVEYGTPASQFVLEPTVTDPGYVGFSSTSGSYRISGFKLTDWESPSTTEDLIRSALAMGDFHDVTVGGATSRIYAVIWGPQTDASTPAAALRQTLEIDKLQLVFRNGYVEVGKFAADRSQPVRRIENEIIESDEVDEVNRRINFASVDGNTDYWMEVDTEDARTRGRHITAYYDLPELLDDDAVIARAKEEIRRGAEGASPGGTTPLLFDVWRMDPIEWVDNTGEVSVVRVEGISVDINQSKTPYQRMTVDTSHFSGESTAQLISNRGGAVVEGEPIE